MTNARPTRTARNAPGFTLVESVVAISILALLASFAGTVLFRGVQGFRAVSTDAELHSEISSAIDVLHRSLREIRHAIGVAGPDIDSVTATSIHWNTADGAAWIELSGGDLLFTPDDGPAQPILSGVTAFTVQCYDESNAALAASLSGAATTAIRRIELTVAASRESQSDTVRTRVFLRSAVEGGSD